MERLKTSIPCDSMEVWETQSALGKPVPFQGCTLTESSRPIIIVAMRDKNLTPALLKPIFFSTGSL